jgi:DNA cross-link repair 1A protein
MAQKAAAPSKSPPNSGRLQQTTLVPNNWGRKSSGTRAGNKAKAKRPSNGDIAFFFKKAEEANNTLFVRERKGYESHIEDEEVQMTAGVDADWTSPLGEEASDERFNEIQAGSKRRKISSGLPNEECTPPPPEFHGITPTDYPKVTRKSGPFADESGSDDSDDDDAGLKLEQEETRLENTSESTVHKEADTASRTDETETRELQILPENGSIKLVDSTQPATLKREETSYPDLSYQDFEPEDDFEDDEYEGGEEMQERRWMEEQERLEMEAALFESNANPVTRQDNEGPEVGVSEEADTPSCPICSINLAGISNADASKHVNDCLDGNPSPLPAKKTTAEITIKAEGGKQFRRPERAPKPGQSNPFVLGSSTSGPSSAFSKLMAGHAEDLAWATAAKAEVAARGKPAYQRTCPFYKILPGFFICVDAFRYGAVKDCYAYFLSHFHSDHYIGLTALWNHGPIYCSKVTGNLVRQQLRVDQKWVVDLEFEQKVEIPNTNGVYVTMIPANHCPGSSLFLFEKVIGKGKTPRTQRVLHCGDFRACRAHVEHPLLRPDVINSVGEKVGQQKLDVCYLDTTYLNPKYAFPSQEEVIKACADMCVSLNKIHVDQNDGWEQMKKERAGEGMVKFIQKGKPETETAEIEDDKVTETSEAYCNSDGTSRGRLLVVVGTYSIGKERICLGIARALNSKIYAPPGKQRICACLEDPELNARLTSDPREAQVHMTPLFEIRADTLEEYLKDYREHFSRAVGFRPTGWNYRPPNSRFVESPQVQTVLHSSNWKSSYSMRELIPQRGSNSRASCFGVPYSEHSSFRELTMFCCALRIDKIIPTVNIGSAKSRERMKAWCERWALEKKKNGLFKVVEDCGW